MPTPPLTDEQCLEALRLIEEHGGISQASRAVGWNRNTIQGRANEAKRRRLHVDPAIKAAMTAVHTQMVPNLAWLKTQPDADGNSYSVMLKPPAETGESIADRITAALEGLQPLPEIPAPLYADEDLLTVYPLADVHLGMLAWGRETGEDYDTRTASERVQSWIGQCVAASPASGTAILLDVGDLTHADDQQNQTPRGKHQIDVDTRHFKTLETAIETLAIAVEIIAARHARVIVRILPGNHNITSYMAILFALAQRYRHNDRITVQAVPGEFFMHEFGRVMVAAHHGHAAKAERMVMFQADEYAEAWGRTRHRVMFTGHLHHHKSQDISGCTWEQLRAVTARDAYAVGHAYVARAQLQAITFHRERGEVQRVKVGY